ncbi:hypothetical protein GCM10007860_26740 [Chitiniphilus shinanonensis]|uniref:CHAT domain-containing protein n=1 Tax=Chitiniphilus shinanonensis TaxID=553088 RepID=A0ABQ6BU42_9NEIS|nr:hypothetical protein [Chitiniphilus shinanonensis]GLS05520.1 hypothetical protein GCM10007860_26740 [Chitiniphilus shinanonensis]
MPNVALLAIESPWWLPRPSNGVASSIPFFESVARNHNAKQNTVNLYPATFFDGASLDAALLNLFQTHENYQLLWIGAHGHGERVSAEQVDKVAALVRQHGKRVKGVILSACEGAAIGRIEQAMACDAESLEHDSFGPNWVLTYRHCVHWFSAALFETALLQGAASAYAAGGVTGRPRLLEMLAASAATFSLDGPFGLNPQGESVTLGETLRLWVRPQRAQQPEDATDELLDAIRTLQGQPAADW